MHHATKRILLAIAAPIELEAVCRGMGVDSKNWMPWECRPVREGIDAILTGIGKSNAAGAVARAASPELSGILSLGIAGVLAPRPFVAGERLLATGSVFADEGVETDTRFLSTEDIGFPMPGVGGRLLSPAPELRQVLRPMVDDECVIATVSTCSGTDHRAEQVGARSRAACEAMEGAAVGLVAFQLGIPFAEVRVISNTTGCRTGQRWELPAALNSLSTFGATLAKTLSL